MEPRFLYIQASCHEGAWKSLASGNTSISMSDSKINGCSYRIVSWMDDTLMATKHCPKMSIANMHPHVEISPALTRKELSTLTRKFNPWYGRGKKERKRKVG